MTSGSFGFKRHLNTVRPAPINTSLGSIGSPASSIKHLIPSLSTFNFPLQTCASEQQQQQEQSSQEEKEKEVQKVALDPPVFDCNDGIVLEDENANPAIRPTAILTERLEAWYLLMKRLCEHLAHLATVENQVAKAYEKIQGILVASRSSDGGGSGGDNNSSLDDDDGEVYKVLLSKHFAYTEGIRRVCESWQAHHRARASEHAAFVTFLKTQALPVLVTIKHELKDMIRSIQKDDRLKVSTLAKMRREAKRRLEKLDRQIAYFEQHSGYGKLDPWLINAGVVYQMVKVYQHTNKMQEAVLRLQNEVLIMEQRILHDMKQLSVERWAPEVQQAIDQLKTDGDWHDFVERFRSQLIPEDAPYRHPDRLQYPNHAHPLLQPVFAARMERNSSVLHRWREHIYVLTPAGFLHEYKSSKNYPHRPDTTLFVPHYNVSTLSTNLHHNLVFQLQPQDKHNMSHSTLLSPSSSTTLSTASYISVEPAKGHRSTLTYRAKSAPDMQAWLEHLTEISYRYRPSVTYNAPPYWQPTNAVNPDIYVESSSPPLPPETQQVQSSAAAETEAADKVQETATAEEKKEEEAELQAEFTILTGVVLPPEFDSNQADETS